MKFFHLSDLHIGLKLLNRDLREDQTYILSQITDLAAREQPDAVIVAGDIFDKAVPSAEAVSLFDRFVDGLSAAVPQAELMFISGNHDSAPRLDLFRGILGRQKVRMIGMPPVFPEDRIEKVHMKDEYGDVCFYLLPFVKPSMVKLITGADADGNTLSFEEALKFLLEREELNTGIRNVLVSHQFFLPRGKKPEEVERMDSEIRMVGNVDAVSAEILSPFDYAALGHIHKPMTVGNERYRYCGTPLASSVSEAGQQKGIPIVELREKGNVSITVLPLEPLRSVKVVRGSLGEVLKQGCGDYVRVELTDQAEYDAADMFDRIHHAFPRLLEIRRENIRKSESARFDGQEAEMDAFALCCAFLGETEETERELLKSVINRVQEEEG